ncbi:MAG TPA: SLC13 family permease [Gemmatimonadaceae bacterium]|nr:SLC13 family permease [Gemmatimonadaceae bacterium]
MLALAIFVATYLLIAVQRLPGVPLNRPAASMLGAVAMVVSGVLTLPEAYAAIDMDVLVFLLGVMLIVGYLESGGFFEWVAHAALARVATPSRLLLATVVGGGVLSAFFVNDTICLVLTPVLVVALLPLGVRPTPYLIALAMGANVGSALSVTGNPQNMLVGIWSGTTFSAFFVAMLPVTAGALALTYGYLRWAFRHELARPFPARPLVAPPAPDRRLVAKALAVFALALGGWLAGGSLPLVAIAAGALMIVVARRDPTEALSRVEWPLLLFFAALFVVMRGFERTGWAAWIDQHTLTVAAHGSRWGALAAMSAALTVLSNLISNVPAVMLWRGAIPALPDAALLWRAVAMSATFAGNLLLIGSMANLIVAERAQARGVTIGFGEYARVGIPVTLLTLAWGIVVLGLTG